jgi:hypothetical protein
MSTHRITTSLLLIISFLSIFIICSAQAKYKKSAQPNQVDVKCHVRLSNELAMISLWRVNEENLATIEDWIVGKSVTPPDSINKVPIIKVFECTTREKKFKSVTAQRLYSNTAL